MYDRDKFDWETREDADTLKRFRQIRSNPDRLRKAQSCILDSINTEREAIGLAPSPTVPSRGGNPATIMKLKTDY